MTISPEEIEHKEFIPAVRGCDRQEVAAFLRVVAADVRALNEEIREARERVRAADHDGYDRLGSEIAGMLRSARDTSTAILAEAHAAAEQVMAEAREHAARVRRGADADGDRIRAEAEEALRVTMAERGRLEEAAHDVTQALVTVEDVLRRFGLEAPHPDVPDTHVTDTAADSGRLEV